MDLNAIRQIAVTYLSDETINPRLKKVNRLYHGLRVAKLAIKLRKYVLPGDSSRDDIITCAAWFHDIETGSENHGVSGARKVRKLLTGHCSDSQLKEICDIIARHSDRSSDRSRFSDYLKLHQDADLLDHFGMPDVWNEISKASSEGQNMSQAASSFIEGIKRYEQSRELLNFEISKYIMDEKGDFFRKFADRLKAEGSGEIYNEELISNYFFNKNIF
ncbi:MAG: HD domain-containing protein [Clostridiales bacterium]|jgi:HD superfamily phosphodiesterase|nr:HD domain-containing protein [Clostridiales bacterium]